MRGADERDFVGYANNPPVVQWPNGSRVAVSICLNYEEGSEQSIALGDPRDETLGEWGGYFASVFPSGIRNRTNESMTEYGSRVGVWRLLDILESYQVKATFFASAMALERNRTVAGAVVDRGHEICSHGYRWEDHYGMSKEEERERIELALRSFKDTTGIRPVGWYSRNGLTEHTRGLLVEAGFLYDSNAYDDDLPYYVEVGNRPHLVIPYNGDLNDVHYWIPPGFATASDFFGAMKDSLDRLLAESAKVPKMMSIGLHMRISGRPSRAVAVERFLEYARSQPGVWFARRDEIARWWLANLPLLARPGTASSGSGG